MDVILHRTDIVIARSVGILCIAGGFITGMHGLDHPDTLWLPTALGLIVTGLIAQVFALVRSFTKTDRAKGQVDGEK